jgi:hypothetical protein
MTALVCACPMIGFASAEDGSFSYSIYAVQLSGNAAIISGALSLPNSDFPGFQMNFVLPQNYKDNGKIRLVFTYGGISTGISCTAVIQPIVMTRVRPGQVVTQDNDGITPADGDISTGFASVAATKEVFNIRRTANFPGQRKGDSILLYMARNPDHELDTCPEAITLYGIDIQYPVDPTP